MWHERCGDCGTDIVDRKVSKRDNICDECWERRGWLVRHPELGSTPEFQAIQRAMGYRRGTAKRKIIALQARLEAGKRE